MKAKFILTALLSIFIVSFSQAQYGHRARIRHGERTGELSRWEAGKLRHEQREFRRDRRYAKSDGRITHRERKMLRHEKRQNSRQIFRKKHNRRERHF